MIKVAKPPQTPSILDSDGLAETATMLSEAALGRIDFDISSSIYGDPSVKAALLTCQFEKCAFCESNFAHVAFGDIEHFRPKQGVTGEHGTLEKPGYFWLAHSWWNLYASCEVCNRKYKRNHFPLKGTRATFDNPDISGENPLMIDPGTEDPSLHIEFIGSIPRGLSERGRETIRLLGLDRETIGSRRREVATDVREHLDLAVKYFKLCGKANYDNDNDYQDVKAKITAYAVRKMEDSSEYAAMVRSIIKQHPVVAFIDI